MATNKKQSTTKNTKKTYGQIYEDSADYIEYVSPQYPWTRKKPWKFILGHFDQACSVLTIPVVTKNKKPLPAIVIIKKPHKKLSIGFDPSRHRTLFDDYDHLILWKNRIVAKIPAFVFSQYAPSFKSEFYENISAPDFDPTNDNDMLNHWNKKSLDEIIEVPIKLLDRSDAKFSQELFQEALKYLRWLDIVPDGRCKHEDKDKINNVLDIIISLLKTEKSVNLNRSSRESLIAKSQLTHKAYDRRSINRIIKDLLDGIKHTYPKSFNDTIISRICNEKLKEIYWDFKAFLRSRKTPPPLRIASKRDI